MLDETGCAGVSIGRGAFYDPWIFQRTLEYFKASGGASRGRVRKILKADQYCAD
jgi:tRNA-dihydrouridine synthase